MIGKGAYEIRPATLAEVERVLEKRQGTVGEFGFEQQTTLDYARRFARLKLSDAQELQSELEKLGLKPETAVKICDILPVNRAQFALIMAKDKAELAEKKMAEAEELVAKFQKKAKKVEPKSAEEAKPAEAAPAGPAAEAKPGERAAEAKKE
jgi:DNA-directed RNA polymerase subunit F